MAALLGAFPGTAQPPGDGPRRVRLGVVTDGPSQREALFAEPMRRELRALLEGEFEIEETLVRADWTVAGVEARLDELLSDPHIDVVLAAGPTASSLAVARRALPKPVIAPFLIDPEAQGAPFEHGASGVPNLVYVAFPANVGASLRQFRELAEFETAALLRAPLAAPTARVVEDNVTATAAELGLRVRVVEASGSAEEILGRLPPDTQAVLLAPLLNLDQDELRRLAAGFVERRLPSFSALAEDVELGILASHLETADIGRLARRVAIVLQRILLGEDAGTLPVAFDSSPELSVNMATARAIGVYPSFAIEADARLVAVQRSEAPRRLTLAGLVREALAANLDLRAFESGVAASREDVRSARAGLLPRLDLSALGAAIDRDRGSALQAQRTLRAGLGLRQVLYSDGTRGALDIQRQLLRSREQDLEELRLDVVRDAATAYLAVLQALTLERITRQNLELTRRNLERARARVRIGVANRSEVHRFEAALAANRRDVIAANARRNVAELEVNRLLRRPLEEPFVVQEIGIDDATLVVGDARLRRFLRDRAVFRVFRAFNVSEALARSPELKQLDAALLAQERALLLARRAFYLPDVGLLAQLDRRFHEGGAGADAPRPFDDWDWQIGVQASLPLFTGGARPAARARAAARLDELRTRRLSVAQRVEQRVRAALHLAGSSHAAIALAQESAQAARASLELVSDAYARGAVSIIELIDAQNAFFVAELSAANALYQFLIDLVEVERAVGCFDVFSGSAEREAYFARLELYAAAAREEGQP